MKSDKRPIEIEDLLRLKRAERPPAEFWTQFDRELRAKQLAALVAKRPWWQRLPRLVPQLSRIHLSLGAAAVLTVTFFAMKDHGGTGASAQPEKTASVRRAPVAAVATSEIAAMTSAPAPGASEIVAQAPAPSPTRALASGGMVQVAHTDAASATETGAFPALAAAEFAGLKSSAAEFSSTETAAGLTTIGSTLTRVAATEPALPRNLFAGAGSTFDVRPGTQAHATVEPLQQITPPGERVRAKLLTAMVSMTAFESPARTGERIADRLSEERLYDQVHRFGARGAGVNMKF